MDQTAEIDLWCGEVIECDCLEALREIPTGSVDLVMCSPPYEDARTYGIDYKLKGQEWVDWAFERFVECDRICKGLTCWVVEGKTRKFQYSATPILLMADLHRAGIRLRKPPAYKRVGIPGSGGPDWLRNDYEFMVCSSHGRLPWSDNTAMGSPPKYPPGGAMSNRHTDGRRRNKKTGIRLSNGKSGYSPPDIANPGNVIDCGTVGGGNMGSDLAHENEAPFPESLAEFVIKSFCPPDGIVLDPFCGSGTTLAVAERLGRRWIGLDIRASQIDLTGRRLAEVQEKG